MPKMTEKLEKPFQKTQRFIHFFQVSPIVKVSSRERFAFCVQQTARQDYSTKSLLNRRKKSMDRVHVSLLEIAKESY